MFNDSGTPPTPCQRAHAAAHQVIAVSVPRCGRNTDLFVLAEETLESPPQGPRTRFPKPEKNASTPKKVGRRIAPWRYQVDVRVGAAPAVAEGRGPGREQPVWVDVRRNGARTASGFPVCFSPGAAHTDGGLVAKHRRGGAGVERFDGRRRRRCTGRGRALNVGEVVAREQGPCLDGSRTGKACANAGASPASCLHARANTPERLESPHAPMWACSRHAGRKMHPARRNMRGQTAARGAN